MTDVSPLRIEKAGLQAWPGIEVEWDGAWIRRAADGYTQRANSVQSLDPSDGEDIPARIAASRTWFETRGLQPIFRITPLAHPHITKTLADEGWIEIDLSCQFSMPLRAVQADARGTLHELLDPEFLTVQQRLADLSDARLAKMRALLAVIAVPARGIVLRDEMGAPVASALMALADGVVITGNVVTDSAQRRKGYGAAMMRTGLAWAHAAGATHASLNVAADNVAGQALYKSLGYSHGYDYHYRVPGPA